MSIHSMIEEAIAMKKQIHATYSGYKREMCPHVLGIKNGKKHCLFYQFGGESSSGRIVPGAKANWRCIDLSRLENVSVAEGEWYTADNHSKSQTCVDTILAEVDY